ncbi:hypothetical protein [Deefgea piscis]|uniref:hypothetical protein n=1 Tax=Deefgea piscis TaxID=2739061 RepID=UPI001C806A23|nr:hypothetical protein [Deefgea piscis]QZA82482.1 hypothetical protein K4H25_07570 [Deefgea piscis]
MANKAPAQHTKALAHDEGFLRQLSRPTALTLIFSPFMANDRDANAAPSTGDSAPISANQHNAKSIKRKQTYYFVICSDKLRYIAVQPCKTLSTTRKPSDSGTRLTPTNH